MWDKNVIYMHEDRRKRQGAEKKIPTFLLVRLMELSLDLLMNSGFRVNSTSLSAFATSRTNASTTEPLSKIVPATKESYHNENWYLHLIRTIQIY